MRYLATHITRYKYQAPVAQCVSEARITPRLLPGQQKLLESRITVEPEPAVFETRHDYYGNVVSAFSVFRPHERLIVTAQSVVEVDAADPDLRSLPWEQARKMLAKPDDDVTLAAYEFIFDSPFVAAHPELSLLNVEGGWSALIQCPATRSDEDRALLALDGGVLVHPGHFFDFDSGCYLVVSLLCEPAVFDAALPPLIRAGAA